MFKYVSDISVLAHHIIEHYCNNFEAAIDCTLGNGYDTDFLREKFQKVYSFEIQTTAVEKYKVNNSENVVLINDSHDMLDEYVREKVDCIMYNLGYLPGGNKSITTMKESTIISIKQAIDILKPGGIITIAIYHGHDEGKNEKEAIIRFATMLPKKHYGVMIHSFLNRSENAPILLVIEKNL